MKHLRILQILTIVLIVFPLNSLAQDCVDYHETGECMIDRQKGFKVYSQSKSFTMSSMDTVQLNIVFYGQKDYLLSFCAHKKMYPIRFTLVDPESRQVIYDNSNDRFIESLGLGFDVTKSFIIKIEALARISSGEEIESYMGCVGLLIQYKNYEQRKVNLKIQ